ncbi:HNH endonuclease signature motif containing protein [Nesterenkonia flava]|uniref:HNH endonuclease signature motif containing protein n=1 Tax=Nesterenkonia flava TaxID=469799 RepID=UPI0035B5A7B9
MSERTTVTILNVADHVQHHLPCTWQAFQEGRIDLSRVRKIADAAEVMLGTEKLQVLDREAVERAERGNLGDLQRWLNRRVPQLESGAYEQACRKARGERHVRFQHLPHGMSLIQAYVPTLEAAAVEKRLKAAARGLDCPHSRGAGEQADSRGKHPTQREPGGGDPRSLAQREVDLFTAWMRDGRVYETPQEAKIMLLIPESTLTGDSNEPALSADRSWCFPADQARALAGDPEASHQWYQGISRPKVSQSGVPEADVDLLSVTYQGRFPPQRLRDALVFRDGTCQAPGCGVPAERCDMDHQTPWGPDHLGGGGPTSAKNLWALCRRHHRMKSHGYLDPPEESEVTARESQGAADPPGSPGGRREARGTASPGSAEGPGEVRRICLPSVTRRSRLPGSPEVGGSQGTLHSWPGMAVDFAWPAPKCVLVSGSST